MVALRKFRSRNVKGYVLLESIVAMVIIMTCFGIAMLIFITASSGFGSKLNVEARIRLHTEAELCKANVNFFDEDIPCSAFTIERRVKKFLASEQVAVLEMRAITPEGKVLAEHYELIQQ